MATPSHLFCSKRPLSFSRVSFPSRSASSSSSRSLSLTQPNLRPRLHLHLACAAITKLSEAEPIPIPQDPEQELDGRIPVGAGVYGVYDSNGELQFFGTSRSISSPVASGSPRDWSLECALPLGSSHEQRQD